jgi:exoribonuclease II
MQDTPSVNSLVLYKTRPARVLRAGDKLEIEISAAGTQRVRPKDVILLHPGPLNSLADLDAQDGEVESAWELLAGGDTTLADLAELAYGEYSPATAWAAWQAVAAGVLFHGQPAQVHVRTRQEVTLERERIAAKAAEEQAWSEFLADLRAGRVKPEDRGRLRDLEALAVGKTDHSRVLRALGRSERPEYAHALLLRVGHWTEAVNPHPDRLGMPRQAPALEPGPLPEELRIDLTHLPAFAIDDEGNLDPDDALSLEGDKIWVHVADAAALVGPDSLADLEARNRGATLYLPEGTVPMLPEAVTARLGMGLQQVSPSLSFGMRLDTGGEIVDLEVVRSWVRASRVTYAEVDGRLEEEPFRSLWRWSLASRERRRASGATLLEFPEVSLRVVGDQISVRPLPPLRSRSLVAEAMMLTGLAAARFASERGIPLPFSTQPPPETREEPRSLAAMFACRKKLKRRLVKTAPEPHAGLGLEMYTQATSPLRRYLDLLVHQQLRAHLRGEPMLGLAEVLDRASRADAAMAAVRRAERQSNLHWTLAYLRRNPGWRGQGILVERRGQRGTVIVPELGLETDVQLVGDTVLDEPVPLVLGKINLPELAAHFQVDLPSGR